MRERSVLDNIKIEKTIETCDRKKVMHKIKRKKYMRIKKWTQRINYKS